MDNNGTMLTEDALKIVARNIESYYRVKAPNGAWCISTVLNAAEQFAIMRAELQKYKQAEINDKPLKYEPPKPLKPSHEEIGYEESRGVMEDRCNTINDLTCPHCGLPLTPMNEVDIGVGILRGCDLGCNYCEYVLPKGEDEDGF